MFDQPITQGPGMETFSSHFGEIFLMLLGAFILGYLLRYFIGAKWRRRVEELEGEVAGLNSKIKGLEGDLEDCHKEGIRIKGQHAIASAQLKALQRELEAEGIVLPSMSRTSSAGTSAESSDYEASDDEINNLTAYYQGGIGDTESGGGSGTGSGDESESEGRSVSGDLSVADADRGVSTANGGGLGLDFDSALMNDNLQIVEGIGPKIESLLKDAGISNWGALSNASESDLKAILEKAGPRYRIHDPSTWPKQAGLANNRSWEELANYQKFLGGGKESGKGVGSGIAKVEKIATKILGVTLYKPDDLKVVEGIGPAIEKLLKQNNIDNWGDLSKTDVNTLRDILASQKDRFRLSDPATWPKQARMAYEGDWKKLREYQDYLQGGKDLAK
jgi:predicted flap endonuclease-1-like 5' DNA nuclease/outer membrane murein-binding lipoprotein Lpp